MGIEAPDPLGADRVADGLALETRSRDGFCADRAAIASASRR
jgi:hypothetical protein